MTIYNVTVSRLNPATVHAVDAVSVDVGRTETGQQGADTVLRFFDADGYIVAAFYDWDWFCKGVLPVTGGLPDVSTRKT